MNRTPEDLNLSIDDSYDSEGGIPEIECCEYDPPDWFASREEIIEHLRRHKEENLLEVWTEEEIRRFLQLHFHLFPGDCYLRHIRTIYTILSEVDL